MQEEIERLKEELRRSDKNFLDLVNVFDERVQHAREQAKREGYKEATERAIKMAVFNIPYIQAFQNAPGRLLGIIIPEGSLNET